MTWPRYCLVLFVLCAAGRAASRPAAGTRTFSVDERQSRALVEVGKSGVFSFAAGHTHEVEGAIAGSITVDEEHPDRSHVRLEIDVRKLTVTGKGESPKDVPKVQQTMLGNEVLDAERHPNIRFVSTTVSVKRAALPTLDLVVGGELTLHGVTRQVSVPVAARIEASGLMASGRFALKQTDYGITPVSVAGVVSVKDTLNISFTIVGK
jgi:polyisoprenoid-binding protein YceI